MNIIISPAKKMITNNDDIASKSMPCFIDKSNKLLSHLKTMTYDDLKKLLICNDKIAQLNFERYENMDLHKNLTPAILAYDGIQYKYMSPDSFSYEEFAYVEKHLKILSGFYGVLKPLDGVTPYRLEMQAKLKISDFNNLYDFWSEDLYNELTKNSNGILNLASNEYSRAIKKYLKPNDKFITCIFGTLSDSKIKVKATEAKMARGLMVRYMAQNNINSIEDVKNFSDLSFSYCDKYSSDDELVFLK